MIAQSDTRTHILAAATPLFARKGLHGVSVRDLATAAGVNLSLISYHFGGKDALYAAVIKEQFAHLHQMSVVAGMDIAPEEKFHSYLVQCGICFHQADGGEFRPVTISANSAAPECPRCLNNDAESFVMVKATAEQAA